MNFTVSKFGGSSVANADQIRKVLAIIESDPARRLIVVSAPGKRHDADTKITDLLIQLAQVLMTAPAQEQKAATIATDIVDRFAQIAENLKLGDDCVETIEQTLQLRMKSDRSDPDAFMDLLKASGEDFSARLIADAITKYVRPARYVSPMDAGLLLSDESGGARVLPEAYENLAALREKSTISVFPGFFGHTATGKLVTFSRGGSDITGAILAVSVKADLYENFTDVDHVCAADPRSVPDAAPVERVTFAEMRELSYAGFGVFHDEALVPVFQARIPVRIKNTNRPDGPGTLICHERDSTNMPVAGIASSGHFISINIGQFLMNREVGYVRRLLAILERHNLSWEHMPSSIDTVSVILRSDAMDEPTRKQLLQDIETELAPESLALMDELAIIMVVGAGMVEHIGVAAQACNALAEAGVNIEMINQGASEISIMFGVALSQRDKAVHALHKTFFLSHK